MCLWSMFACVFVCVYIYFMIVYRNGFGKKYVGPRAIKNSINVILVLKFHISMSGWLVYLLFWRMLIAVNEV